MDYIKLVVDLLSDALACPVMTDIPRDRPERLVVVDLDADSSTSYLLTPRVSLTCWGTSDRDAHGLALSALQALQDAALDHDYLSDATLFDMTREEWSRNGQGRYQVLVDLTINVD